MNQAILRARLEALWAQLEALGAVVARRGDLSVDQATALCAAEWERLRVLSSPEARLWAAWTAPDHMRSVA